MNSTIQPPRPPIPSRGGETTGRRPLPKGVVGLAQMDRAQAATRRDSAPSGTLIVGQGIHVKGEIEDCRTLVVEGRVEASVRAETLEVHKGGLFQGTAEVERAEIAGTVEGTLSAREQVTVAQSGRVSGKIRYARISIEAGGEISGDVDAGAGATTTVEKPTLTGTGA